MSSNMATILFELVHGTVSIPDCFHRSMIPYRLSLSASQLAGGWFKGKLIPSTILKFILDKEERNQM